jgi:hypothetical protein
LLLNKQTRCATFFRADRFSLVKKYEVEFNKAALSLSEALSAANQKKAALNRLLKVSALSAATRGVLNRAQGAWTTLLHRGPHANAAEQLSLNPRPRPFVADG